MICGAVLAVGAAGVAVATPDTEHTTDQVSPTQFDTNESDVLWESDVDLDTRYTPTVVDGILVTTTGGISPDRVTAYDVGTGEKRWSVDVLARGSPTVVDGTVYVSNEDGVWALDLELGTIEWHVEFDEDAISSGSQSVGDGSVYISWSDDGSSGQALSLDADTGDENWNFETDEIKAGPTFIDGTVYFITVNGMTALDAENGDEQWQWGVDDGIIDMATEPTAADGFVYLSHTAGDDDPGIVSAVDTTTGETAWTKEIDTTQEALPTLPTTPTVAGENNEPTIYVGYDGLHALNATDGTERWSDDAGVFDAPTVADGTLFVPQTIDSEAFRALDPNDGTEQWSVETGDRSDVIVVDGVVYVAVQTGDNRLMAIDTGVSGSSSDSRVMLGGQNHHHEWTGEIPDADPRVVDAEFDEGVFVGDELTVLAAVRNDWDPTTSATYTLEVDGTSAEETIEVPAFGTNTVEFSVTAPNTAGEYTLDINGEEVGTLTVVDDDDPVFRSVLPFFDTRLESDLIQIAYNATNLGDEFVEENATLALEGPAFDGREDVAFSQGPEGLSSGETETYLLITDPIDDPGDYTAYIEDKEIGTIEVLPASNPVYLTDVNRFQDSIISGVEAPIDPSAAGEASVDVRYENLGETQDSVESELVAYDGETEVATVSETIVVDGESNSTERLSVSLSEEGVYDLEVDGQSVGEVEVLVDGVQDGNSIQAAIDAALPGDEVVVGDGTYEESLTIDKPLTLRTVSDGGAVLDGGDGFERAITVTDDDVTVEGFQIDGYTGSGNADSAVVADGEEFTFVNNTITNSVDAVQTKMNKDAHGIVIADNHIHDNDGDAIAFSNRVHDASVLRNIITDNSGNGLDLGNQNDQFVVNDNEIHGNDIGITYDQSGGDDGTVTNNTVTDNTEAGINLDTFGASNNVVINNAVTGNDGGIVAGNSAEIRHNHVSAVKSTGIEVGSSATVANNTIEDVGNVGIDAQGNTVIESNAISDASIAISSDGDGLEVHANEFLDTEIDLLLDDATDAIVTDNEFATGVGLANVPEALDEEPHEMSGNTVGGDPLVYVFDEDDPEIDPDAGQIILVDVTDVDLDGYSFSDVTAGVQITHAEEITLTDSEFSTISDAFTTPSTRNIGAISVWHSSVATVDEFTITDSERGVYVADSDNVTVSTGSITASDRDAIITRDTTGELTIADNTVTGSDTTAISVNSAGTLSVVGNNVTDTSSGIDLSSADDAVIEDNVVSDVRFTGVRLAGSIGELAFTNNTVTDGANNAVLQPGGGTNSITGNATFVENTIDNNGGDGASLRLHGDHVTVTDNVVSNNGEVGIDLDIDGETATVTNNAVTDNGGEIGFDIHLDTTDSTVASNTVRNNGDGLAVTGATADGVNITLVENIIEENAGTGLTVGGFYENFLVTENAIVGNGDGLFFDPGDEYVLNATNNWWGATDGPSGDVTDPETDVDADGGGDSIVLGDQWWLDNESVLFDPWLEAPLVDTGGLEGTVSDADTGDTIAGATVEVRDGAVTVDTVETDVNGFYEFSLVPGTYDLAVVADGYGDATETNIDLTADETTIRDLELTKVESSITGTVVDAETNDPVADAQVELVEQEDVGDPTVVEGGFAANVTTDENGAFEVQAPPGVYQFTVGILGFDEAFRQNMEVRSGEQTDVDTIELTSVPVVTGTVTDSVTGDPLEGASVESRTSESFDTTVTNATGEYAVNVPDGLGTIRFEAPGYLLELVDTDGEEIDETERVDVELTAEGDLGTITGEITHESTGEPVQGAIVTARESGVTTVADAEGTYALELEPGTYALDANEEDGLGMGTTEGVEVTAGETTTADIILSEETPTPPETNVSVSISESDSVTDVTEGETASIAANVTNEGESETEYLVVLSVVDEGVMVVSESPGERDPLFVSDPHNVTLEPNETESVSFTFEAELEFDGADARVDAVVAEDTDIQDFDAVSLTVAADESEPESELEVLEATVTPAQLETGEEASINATIENVGETDGELTVPLEIDGEEVETTTVTLDAGESTDVTFTRSFETAGEYQLAVGGLEAGTVTVIEDADILIYGADVNQSAILLGDTITITGDLLNNGGAGTYDVDLNVDGERVENTTVEVGTGATPGAVEFEWTPTEADLPAGEDEMNATISLNGFIVETVFVENQYSDIQVIAASTSEIELIEGEHASVVGSIYQAGNVEGTEEISLNATHQETGETESIGSQEVTLSPGFYHLGAINITFEPDEAGTYDLELGDRDAGTVEVEPAESDIQVIAASTSEIELIEGEHAYVIGSIYQAGNIEGTEELSLNATHQETGETELIDTQEATLEPGFYHLGALNITFEPDEAGTYDLELGDRNAGTVEVEPAESDIQVIAGSTSEIELIEGEHAYVVGSIYQAGNVEGTEKISLNATHQETGETEVVGSQEVTLSPGFYHLGAINITFVPDEAGTYDLELGDRNAGTVDVEPAESDIQVIAASVADVEMLQTEETYVIGSIYQSGNVEGPQEIELNATHRGTNETHTVDTVEKELAPGFYHLGALNVTFEPEEAGTYDLELGDRNAGFVEVEPAEPDIQVIAASASEVEIIQGEEFSVTGSIYNSGDVEGTETIELTATHNESDETHVLGSQEVTAASNVSYLGAINITAEFDEPGYYDLELGDRDAGLMAVEEAITDITVIAASTEDIELIEGEETYVIGSVYQGGNVEETEEISLNATHQETGETEVIGSQEVTLAPGFYHLGALNITFEPNEAGTYDLELGDRDAGTVDVEPAESDIQVIAASQSATELIEGEDTYVVGSVYQAGNIEGTEEIALNATHQETGETEVIGSQEVTLAPGFYHLGAINITVEFNQAGTYDLELGDTYAGSVDVEPAESDIQVIAGSTSEIELIEGEHAYVVGSIYQAGNVEGTEEISLNATHQETGETELIDTQEVTLAPGFYHLGAINITFEPDEAGTYDLELGDTYAGTVDVEPAESDIQVIAASTSQIELIEGEHAYVVGSVYQGGNVEGTEEISLNATHKETGETEAIGSQEVTLAPGFYHLGAINITAEFNQAGTYDLELGDRNAGTIDVTESTVEASIVDVEGHSVSFDPETETEQVHASEDVPVTVEIDADLDLETVNVLVSSLETNYVRSFEASHDEDETWTATVSPAAIEDDGRYEVSVVAVDRVGSAGTDIADNPLVIDRDAPRLSATLEDVDSEGATVVVESDKPLAEPPEVEGVFTAPDNSTESGSVSMLPISGSDTHFTGTFATGETGTYEITSVGTDHAGNEGTDTASVTVDTRFTLEDGVIEIDDTGTAIEFEAADEADEAVLTQDLFASLSETTANANLGDGQLGVGFITADLDNLLDYYLEEGTIESASISMAIDEEELPGSASADEVELHYYDDTSGSWDPVAGSTVTQIDDDPFLTASVTGFSTYGAFVPDTEPPVISDRSPTDGSTLDSDVEETTVRFEYADDRSGIDVGTVRMKIDGEDVTASDDTDITSSAAEHTLTLEPGTSYSATITVADTTGNTATADTEFSVAESDSGGSESGGGSFPVPTDPTTDVPEIPTGTNATDTARTTLETHLKTGVSTATFETDDGIREIAFDEAADGEVVVRTLDGVPGSAASPSGTVLSVVQIAVPESLTDSPATITTAVPTAQLEAAGATSDGLVISRLDSDSGEWDSLETTVAKETTDSVVINAETPGSSVFVVTADATDSTADDKSGKESEPADETTADDELGEETEPVDERTDELDDDEMPGFSVTISLVVLLCLVVAARQRASTDRQ